MEITGTNFPKEKLTWESREFATINYLWSQLTDKEKEKGLNDAGYVDIVQVCWLAKKAALRALKKIK